MPSQNYTSTLLSYGTFKCRYLLAIGAYGNDTPITRASLPDNPAAQRLAAGLAGAHRAYSVPSAAVLFVVQDPERNAFDQRWLEYCLLEDYGIQTCRMTLPEIARSAKLHDRRLIVPKFTTTQDTQEISVVYLRAGYGPGDYSDESMWEARKMLELSRAVKCPTIITQLAGCKKVQQVLAMPGVLERYHFKFVISDVDLLIGMKPTSCGQRLPEYTH